MGLDVGDWLMLRPGLSDWLGQAPATWFAWHPHAGWSVLRSAARPAGLASCDWCASGKCWTHT